MKMKNLFTKKNILSVLSGACAIWLFTMYSTGSPAGYTGSPSDGSDCSNSSCHANGPATHVTNMFTSDIPISGYIPGITYNITVTLTGSGSNTSGFEASPQNATGTLLGTLIAGTGSQLVGSEKYVTHSAESTTGTWTFQWMAPIKGTGDVTFYGAGALAFIQTVVSSIVIHENTGVGIENVKNEIETVNVYPNPVFENLNISYSLNKESNILIQMFDMNGKLVNTLVNEYLISGKYTKVFTIDNRLEKGIYFVRINKENTSLIKKIIVQ